MPNQIKTDGSSSFFVTFQGFYDAANSDMSFVDILSQQTAKSLISDRQLLDVFVEKTKLVIEEIRKFDLNTADFEQLESCILQVEMLQSQVNNLHLKFSKDLNKVLSDRCLSCENEQLLAAQFTSVLRGLNAFFDILEKLRHEILEVQADDPTNLTGENYTDAKSLIESLNN